jgi:hypothetical protein
MSVSDGESTSMPEHRTERARPTERLNRVLLTILGVLLVAAGIYTLLRSWGALGDAAADDPLFTPAARNWVDRNQGWFWPVMAGLSTLIALLAVRWLIAQLRTDRPGSSDLAWSTPSGRTRIQAGAIADAVSDDIESDPGVERAVVRMVGDEEHPELHLYLDARDDASLAELRDHLETGAIPRLRSALELDDVAAHARFRLVAPSGRVIQ